MNPFARSRAESRPNPTSFREGDYLADQLRLYCVVHVFRTSRRSAAAILEDCRTLGLVALATQDLASLGLRVVRPAATA